MDSCESLEKCNNFDSFILSVIRRKDLLRERGKLNEGTGNREVHTVEIRSGLCVSDIKRKGERAKEEVREDERKKNKWRESNKVTWVSD